MNGRLAPEAVADLTLKLVAAKRELTVEQDRATDAWLDRDNLIQAIDHMCDEAERTAGTPETHVTVSVLRTLLDPYRAHEPPEGVLDFGGVA